MDPIRQFEGIAYARYGQPGGIPTIALHGSPGSHLSFRPLAAAAQARGLDLIAIDRFGYGATSVAPTRDFGTWAAKMSSFVKGLGLDRPAILANSGGAPYGIALAAECPDSIRSLAVVAGVGELGLVDLNRHMLRINLAMIRAATFGPRTSDAVGTVIMALSRVAPSIFLKYGIRSLPTPDRDEMRRRETHDNYVDLSRQLGPSRGVAFGVDFYNFCSSWADRASLVTAPFEWWHGLLDRNVPIEHARHVMERNPHGVLHEVPGRGHVLLRLVLDDVAKFIQHPG